MGRIRFAALVVGTIISMSSLSSGAVVFQDDFSDGATSNLNWVESNDFITKSFANGQCVSTNSSTTNSGYLYHAFSEKYSTYTVSAKLTRSTASAHCGFAIGFNDTTYLSTIFLLSDATLYFSISDSTLAGVQTSYINPYENILKVSVNDTVINIFVNDYFVKTVTTQRKMGKNFAFYLSGGTTTTVDDFVMTDEFAQTTERTSFGDDFESGLKVDWVSDIKSATAAVAGGVLTLNSENSDSSYAYLHVDNVHLTNFTGKAVFSHKSGNPSKIYGLVLWGDDDSARSTFAITASKYFGAVAGAQAFNLTTKQSIRGKAYTDATTGAVTYYKDTLEIIKRAGSDEYIFVANKDTLTRLTTLTFSITKVGVFCQDSTVIDIDDFLFTSLNTSVRTPYVSRSVRGSALTVYRENYATDVLGRTVGIRRVLDNKVSSGLYMARTGSKAGQLLIINKVQ